MGLQVKRKEKLEGVWGIEYEEYPFYDYNAINHPVRLMLRGDELIYADARTFVDLQDVNLLKPKLGDQWFTYVNGISAYDILIDLGKINRIKLAEFDARFKDNHYTYALDYFKADDKEKLQKIILARLIKY
ncbi:hypothetical protein [Mycoplasmopsis opalescens]|uniref:hypothetical protein n=1 Tax=Mycoplasmopsis opalescens TaxID=114886 RepID=UPI0004A71F01|nr:hypothetical protein [Mycoplasmopsis opalescens]